MELTLGSMAWGRVAQILALLFAVLCAAPVMAGDSIMTGTRVAGDETRTRFVADLTLPVGYTVYVLPDPYRVIIDMPQIRFDLPDGAGRQTRGLVTAFRYGDLEAGKSRLVLDTQGPVLIEKSFIAEAQAGQPARMVVDLVRSTPEAFQATLAQDEGITEDAIAAANTARDA